MNQKYVIGILVLATCGCILNTHTINKGLDIEAKMASYMLLMWTLAIVYYICMWYYLVRPTTLQLHLLPGLIWPIVIFVTHILTNKHQTAQNEMNQHHGTLVMESNSICSLALSIGGLLAAAKGSKKHENLFITALILVVGFVLPSFSSISQRSMPRMLIHILQKVAHNCAIGLLLTGICMYVSENRETLGENLGKKYESS